MGMSKAMAEKLLIAKSRIVPEGGTVICATRYGNVSGFSWFGYSFVCKSITSRRTINCNDPLMTRFLMSLEYLVDLVFHAFEHAKQGDIFVQKAPASTVDLAQALKELYNSELPIKIIGTRYGEKLYESLISREGNGKS